MKVTLAIDGMHCGGCVRAVQGVLSAVEHVSAVEVSLERAQASVGTAQPIDPGLLIIAVEDAGYEARLLGQSA